jgi:hypothetical protein
MPGSPTVAFATCQEFAQLCDDDQLLLAPLAAAGIDATPAVWDDPDVEWSHFDLVVVRSTWDYVTRRNDFVSWARSVERLANPADVLAWNTDKRYLRDLADAGVPVVDTVYLEPGNEITLATSGEVVLKPAISAGSRDTGRYDLGRADHQELAVAHVAQLLHAGRTVMVQPYLAAVDTDGERALLVVGGNFSHSVRKGAILTGPSEAFEDLYQPETITPRTATDAEISLALRTLDAVPGGAARLTYARVDLIDDAEGATRVLEVELSEPSMFLTEAPGSADRFADAIAQAARSNAAQR